MQLQQIANLFEIEGQAIQVRPLGNGLINDTYLVETDSEDQYVLQRINTYVFPDVDLVMNNIASVTNHIRKRLDSDGVTDLKHRVLQFMPSRANSSLLYVENEGTYWRLMVYVDHTLTKQEVNTENAYAAGVAFGHFQALLADLPETLGETIPDFHNMEFRLQQLREICQKNPVHRLHEPAVQELLRDIEVRAEEMTAAERLYRAGLLPKRVCHCDTKVNNMLFSQDGKDVLCIIDLDTVMPSFIFSDYGDFLRTAANPVAEDEPNFSLIAFRQDIYEAFTQGYLSQADSFLSAIEKSMLPFAVRLFPFMQSVRFLWDYLCGDHYWKVKYTTHNLVRAQNQMHYLKCIEDYQFQQQALTVGCVNWPDAYPYCPEVKAWVYNDDQNLYLHCRVREQSVRAVAQRDNDAVWEDSCVEFFFKLHPNDTQYYNIECNCTGKVLLGVGADRNNRQHAPSEVMKSIWRWSSLGEEPFEEREGECTWEVKLRIPRQAFFLHHIESLSGLDLQMNIYKCGDLLSEPHFVSLYPISAPAPDFHRPEFFR